MLHRKALFTERNYPLPDGYGCEEVTPRGYASLMDLYENNFLRLSRLTGRIDALPDEVVSVVEGCLDLHLQVIERSRYTTTIQLTYLFDDGHDERIAEPDLRVQIYHDANLVEVVGGHLRHGRQKIDNLPAGERHLKWRLNRFLFRWLGYCLYLGHDLGRSRSEEPDKELA